MPFCVDFSNPFIIIFLCGSVLTYLINLFLEITDYSFRKQNNGRIPSQLKNIEGINEIFTEEKLTKISSYENAKFFLFIPSSLCNLLVNVALVVFGFYPFILNLITSFTGISNTIGTTFIAFFLFMILTSIPSEIVSSVFSIYREFVIEKKFGFSKMTVKLWISDFIKELVVSLVFSAILCFLATILLVKCKTSWWFILAILLVSITFLMQIIYPKFISPRFNKFNPLEEGELKQKLEILLKKADFISDGVFIMDASKRSSHSNAYFTGLGKTKRIVLFDTLVKKLTPDEITAVLGHEIGHYKLKHILRRMIFMIPLEIIMLFVLYKLSQSTLLYKGFGFSSFEDISLIQYVGIFLSMTLFSSIQELISPISNYFSRKDEYQADKYSHTICSSSKDLITALVKLNSENLSELFIPDLYVFWNYSHPTIVERIERLEELDKE